MRKIKLIILSLLSISFFSAAFFVGCTKPDSGESTGSGSTSETPGELVLDDPEMLEYIVAEKSSSHTDGRTVHPGEEITFTFSITNNGTSAALVSVTDTVPENTSYVSGCDEISGDSLYWTVSIEGGETETVEYTVEVFSDLELCEDGRVESVEAKVAGQDVTSETIYIKRTLNEEDEKNVSDAINALSASCYKGGELVKWIYNVAFSHTFLIDGTPSELLNQILILGEVSNSTSGSSGNAEESAVLTLDLLNMVVPTLFGGTSLPSSAESRFGTASSGVVSTNGLVAGDILLTQADINNADSGKMYMYGGENLVDLTDGVENVDTQAVLSGISENALYVVLRPSFALDVLNYSQPAEELSLTSAQEALLVTAKSYLLRGERMQYEDTRLGPYTNAEFRWQIRAKSPEDYTVDEWGYSNCAAFTYDVYYFGLGYDIGKYTTDKLISASSNIRPYYYAPTGTETEAEQIAVEQQFNAALQPGDIIVIRYKSSGGHAMLYVGNGKIIHSSGSVYKLNTSTEVCEPTIRYMQVKDLFTTGNSRHIFTKTKQLGIVRPLNTWTGAIPENTVNRVNNMQGIVAEKLSSHTSGMTANLGEEITFTYSIFNTNSYSVTLDVSDVVPQNTTYVSGAQTITGNKLSWSVTVPAGEAVKVSYKVKVNDDATYGSYVESTSGKVGGVSTNCKKIYIRKTLTAQEQQKILEAVEALKDSGSTGLALVNEIYKQALGKDNVFASTNLTDIGDGVFTLASGSTSYYVVNESGDYSDMIASNLYGGRKFYSLNFDGTRTRGARKQHLIIGDVLFARSSSAYRVWLFVGDGFIELTGDMNKMEDANLRLSQVLAFGYYYAVLRPSMSLV